jgi:peptide/nickel transport system permease protein
MRAYITRRLFLILPTLFVTTVLIFFLLRLMPGTVVDALIAELAAVTGGEEVAIEANRVFIERSLGLDAPIHIQYGRWMGLLPDTDGKFSGIFQGDLGISLRSKKPVIDLIAPRLPVTLELGLLAILIAQLIALPIGVFSALRQDTFGDYLARSFAILCIAVPGFWLGTMVIVFPSIWWGWSPPIRLIPFAENPVRNLQTFLVPAIVLGMVMSGTTMRMTRTMMLEVLRQDYIRTAWSKGLREGVVVARHGLKNALISVITIVGLQVPVIVGGAVIMENIFHLPGMGQLIINAIQMRDYTTVSGIMLILAVVIMLINLAVDLTYGFLDPRIHYR